MASWEMRPTQNVSTTLYRLPVTVAAMLGRLKWSRSDGSGAIPRRSVWFSTSVSDAAAYYSRRGRSCDSRVARTQDAGDGWAGRTAQCARALTQPHPERVQSGRTQAARTPRRHWLQGLSPRGS